MINILINKNVKGFFVIYSCENFFFVENNGKNCWIVKINYCSNNEQKLKHYLNINYD